MHSFGTSLAPIAAEPALLAVSPRCVVFAGRWPGWEAAIALVNFTKHESHEANPYLIEALKEMRRDAGYESVEVFEDILYGYKLVPRDTVFAASDYDRRTITGREYYELLKDATRAALTELGSVTIGPYLLDPYLTST